VIKISYIDISAFTPEIYARILSLLPDERREKAEGYSFENGKYLSAAAGYLLILVAKERGINIRGAKICKKKGGKPYIDGNPFYFNLSHSGNIALIASSEFEVGVDIEIIGSVRKGVIKRAYAPSEQAFLDGLGDAEKKDAFFRMWTAKESVVKYFGAGLSFPFKDINISLNPAISADIKGKSGKLFLKEYSISGYKTTVCSAVNDFADEPKEINIFRS